MSELSHKERMQKGMWYDANFDKEMCDDRFRCDCRCTLFNKTSPLDKKLRKQLIKEIMPNASEDLEILAPVTADYGYNIFIGRGCFINHGAYFLDCAPITLGDRCFLGPNCAFYTVIHPLLPHERKLGYEKAKPITVGSDVWFGGNVVVLQGVTIGDGAVIGAGSVVLHDIPPMVVAAGNPCRVIRPITDQDSMENNP